MSRLTHTAVTALLASLALTVLPAAASDTDCANAIEYSYDSQNAANYATTVCGSAFITTQSTIAAFRAGVLINAITDACGVTDPSLMTTAHTNFLNSYNILSSLSPINPTCAAAIDDTVMFMDLALGAYDECLDGMTTPDFGCVTGDVLDTCWVDLYSETITCDGTATPATIVSTSSGMTVQLEMADYAAVRIESLLIDATDWSMHFANSPTNDGYCGDSGSTDNDSEAWITNDYMALCSSDVGASTYLESESSALDASYEELTVEICDGEYHYQSSTYTTSVYDDTIFQIDGDEADIGGSLNDTDLWLGINRVVGSTARTGTGVERVTLTFLAP